MEIKGRVVAVLEMQKGTSARGPWQKRYAVIETESKFPKKVCLMFWGDLADHEVLKPGSMLDASIEIESREYNGRWYTDVKVWKVNAANSGSTTKSSAPQDDFGPESPDDVLPF